MDFTNMTDNELLALLTEVQAESLRRASLEKVPEKMDDLSRKFRLAAGMNIREEWEQPSSAVSAYPFGWLVTHNGAQWRSTVAGNVWEPGVSGWRAEIMLDGSPTPWVAPSGAHDAYNTGERAFYEGYTYVSRIDGNVWSPNDYVPGWAIVLGGTNTDYQVPAWAPNEDYDTGEMVHYGSFIYKSLIDDNAETPVDVSTTWRLISLDNSIPYDPNEDIGPPVETPVDPPVDPEPETPAVAEWVQPVGAHDAYKKGDIVTYQGKQWTSTADANVWAPGVYGWTQL